MAADRDRACEFCNKGSYQVRWLDSIERLAICPSCFAEYWKKKNE